MPKDLYRVRTDDGETVLASIPAQTRRVSVKFIPGDRVTVEVSAYDPSRGRIRVE
ncbi:MAG: translation initiation factor IF-1 [Myxococcales bacterium]|nr:translation initiation factor IF-1 [Myxococcales bacterium]